MAETSPDGHKSFVAGEALDQYVMVYQSGPNEVSENDDGTTNRTIGVTQHAADAGEHVTVKLLTAAGTTKLKVDGSGTEITVGASLVAGTGGQGIDQSTSGAMASYVACDPSSAAGTIIEAAPSLHQVA